MAAPFHRRRQAAAPMEGLPLIALAPAAFGAMLAHAGEAEARDRLLDDAPDGSRRVQDASLAADVEAARTQGRALLQQGKVVEALQQYNQALARDPDSVETLNAIAVCYDRMGKFETSRTYYETALGIDPRSALLLNNYGYSLYLQGERAEAARFLGLAIATGDQDVQATALRILAKIEADNRRAPVPRAMMPDVLQASAPVPVAALSGPQIVRTSDHEVRLVLAVEKAPDAPRRAPRNAAPRPDAPMPVAPAILAETLGDRVAAVLPVAALSAEDDRRIADAEAAAIRRDAMAAAAQAQAQAHAAAAAATAAVPAAMQAMIDLALGARPAPAVVSGEKDPLFRAPRPVRLEEQDPAWNNYQLLVLAPRPGGKRESDEARAAEALLVTAAGLPPVRRQPALATPAVRPSTEPLARKRSYERPFDSDDERLNAFAARVQAEADAEPDVAEKIARLEALIARVSAA